MVLKKKSDYLNVLFHQIPIKMFFLFDDEDFNLTVALKKHDIPFTSFSRYKKFFLGKGLIKKRNTDSNKIYYNYTRKGNKLLRDLSKLWRVLK